MIKSENLKINQKNSVLYITFPSLEKTGCVKHGFTTKLGGVSKGIFESMNMGLNRGDNIEDVKENYRRFCEVIGVKTESCVLSKQTHTTNVINVTLSDKGRGFTVPSDWNNIDGLITNEKGITLVTQYADCVPLLFCDPVKKVVATSHAGWRGTVNEIGRITVEKMVKDYGSDPKDICVGIGPSISKCCFEIDTPVYEEFCKMPFDITEFTEVKGNGKYNLDLQGINRKTLLNIGIKSGNISVSDLCTKCHSDIFFSHRATAGRRGNLAAFIALDF